MKLPGYQYDDIISDCVELFMRYDVRNIPIDCFEIAAKMGVLLKPYSSLTNEAREIAQNKSEDGFALLREEGVYPFITKQWYIFYNDKMSKNRIRFTVMHEIGHIVRDHTEESDLAEAEANFFAKYSLAPPPLVHKTNPEDYLDIAETFEVSWEFASHAMSYYKKWLIYGDDEYTPIETKLLRQFKNAI